MFPFIPRNIITFGIGEHEGVIFYDVGTGKTGQGNISSIETGIHIPRDASLTSFACVAFRTDAGGGGLYFCTLSEVEPDGTTTAKASLPMSIPITNKAVIVVLSFDIGEVKLSAGNVLVVAGRLFVIGMVMGGAIATAEITNNLC